MGVTASGVRADFNQAVDAQGQIIRIKYFTPNFGAGSYYDDDITLSQSGVDVYISGAIQPITQTRGSFDSVLLEQGKILTNDSKMYIDGTTQTGSGDLQLRFGIGSPITREFSIIPEGVVEYNINGESVYKKIFLRHLPNGSLVGEA